MSIALEARGVAKHFQRTQALRGIDFQVLAGEVHGLVGANGAGKSTLVKILTGVIGPDEGSVMINGIALPPGQPDTALHSGVAAVYQDEQLVPEMTVLDNLMLGRYESFAIAPLPRRRARRELAEQITQLGFHLPLGALVADLPQVRRKEVEIVKALTRAASVLLLDEPTAALPERDVVHLLEIVRRVAATGVAVVFISHLLEQVLAVCHRVTVLSNGKVIGTWPCPLDKPFLLNAMFPELTEMESTVVSPESFGRPMIEAVSLSRPPFFHEVSLSVREGEIAVLTGLVGSGKSEVLRAIGGVDRFTAGTVSINGRERRRRAIRRKRDRSVGFVPEDRARQGLFMIRSIRENITSSFLSRLSVFGWIRSRKEDKTVARAITDVHVVAESSESPVGSLSGGNQQKVVMARALAGGSNILLLDEPTAGVDAFTRGEIYRLVRASVENHGCALVASSDIEEVLTLGQTIYVLQAGRIVKRLEGLEVSRESVLEAIGGR